MIFKIKIVRLQRTYMPRGRFFTVGYHTASAKEIGKIAIAAETEKKAAENLRLREYLAFTFLPRNKFSECEQLLKNGFVVTAYLIEKA